MRHGLARDDKNRSFDPDSVPFGAMDVPPEALRARPRAAPAPAVQAPPPQAAPAREAVAFSPGAPQPEPRPHADGAQGDGRRDWRRQENRRGNSRRGGRRRNRNREDGEQGQRAPGTEGAPREPLEPGAAPGALDLRREHPDQGHFFGPGPEQRRAQPGGWNERSGEPDGLDGPGESGGEAALEGGPQQEEERGGRFGRRRRRRRGQGQGFPGAAPAGPAGALPQQHAHAGQAQRPGGGFAPGNRHAQARAAHAQGGGAQAAPQTRQETLGMFLADKGSGGFLRSPERMFLPSREDVFVPPNLVARFKLRDGSLISGFAQRGQGPSGMALVDVSLVDGKDPRELGSLVSYKKLVSIDPDFHYELGNQTGDISMKILDLICPIGRGTRGLLVAPPRSGKTILMQKFACGIQEHYSDVQLFVLLVDERPEEATEWKRIIKPPGMVFVSTNDERADNHVALCEAVWARATRLVELGQDVVLVLDSITRMARSYNNVLGNSGKTMSGGLDTRAMERPKQFFGSARNTETAGSLTILGTTLVETGSRMDQVIFEEFKGTGNMELVLSRKLADRRIFPSIDIEKSGTRKEEKLLSSRRLKQIQILRRVLLKMNFVEAMELLITKLDDVDDIDVFLKRFEVDPDK